MKGGGYLLPLVDERLPVPAAPKAQPPPMPMASDVRLSLINRGILVTTKHLECLDITQSDTYEIRGRHRNQRVTPSPKMRAKSDEFDTAKRAEWSSRRPSTHLHSTPTAAAAAQQQRKLIPSNQGSTAKFSQVALHSARFSTGPYLTLQHILCHLRRK